MLLMRSATPFGQHLAIHEFNARELNEFNWRGLSPSRSSGDDSVKTESSFYSGAIIAESIIPRRRRLHRIEAYQDTPVES